MSRRMIGSAAFLVAGAVVAAVVAAAGPRAGDDPSPERWKGLEFFVGTWKGEGESFGTAAAVERKVEAVLGGQFINVRNKSSFDAREGETQGEVHEDWGMISFDRARERFVLREYHVEGFMNQYVLQPQSDPKVFVFMTESIENGPPDWRARLTLEVVADDEFTETFDLDTGSGELKTCVSNRLRRVK